MFKIEDTIWTLGDYLESLCGNDLAVADLDEFEAVFGEEIWNYPISEIEHCIEIGGEFVIVAFPDMYEGFEYRICEVKELPEDFGIFDEEDDY